MKGTTIFVGMGGGDTNGLLIKLKISCKGDRRGGEERRDPLKPCGAIIMNKLKPATLSLPRKCMLVNLRWFFITYVCLWLFFFFFSR